MSIKDEDIDKLIYNEGINPKPLNLIQKAIKKNKEPLKDGITYDGVLVRVESFETKKGVPTLSYVYDVNGVEVSDMYYFSIYSIQGSIDRLIETLKKFDFDINLQTANEGVESLAYFTKYLVGSKVKLIQTTRETEKGSYPNYKISEVTKLVSKED